MLSCVSGVWNGGSVGAGGTAMAAVVLCSQHHGEKDTWNNGRVCRCTHQWETLKRTSNNTARVRRFHFFFIFVINPFGFAAQLHSHISRWHCIYWLWSMTNWNRSAATTLMTTTETGFHFSIRRLQVMVNGNSLEMALCRWLRRSFTRIWTRFSMEFMVGLIENVRTRFPRSSNAWNVNHKIHTHACAVSLLSFLRLRLLFNCFE